MKQYIEKNSSISYHKVFLIFSLSCILMIFLEVSKDIVDYISLLMYLILSLSFLILYKYPNIYDFKRKKYIPDKIIYLSRILDFAFLSLIIVKFFQM